MRGLFAAIALVLVSACTLPAPSGGGDILAIGDSAMAWNVGTRESIPNFIAAETNRSVVNASVSGAVLIGGIGRQGIPAQYPGGRWNWIVINGGANDLGLRCGCGSCAKEVNRLISPDLQSGAIPALMKRLRSTGARIIWMGYYDAAKGGYYKGCRDDLHRMEARIERFVAKEAGLFFVDGADVIDPTDVSNFTRDKTHPSEVGSERVGRYLGKRLLEFQ